MGGVKTVFNNPFTADVKETLAYFERPQIAVNVAILDQFKYLSFESGRTESCVCLDNTGLFAVHSLYV
jgi:hypothetical protein